MILSKIIKTRKPCLKQTKPSEQYLNTLIYLKSSLNNLRVSKLIYNTIQQNQSLNLEKRFKLKKNSCKLNNFITKSNTISYIIDVILLQTNTIVNVTDVFGNSKLSMSAGSINLTKTQKKTQPMAIISLFKTLLLKARFLQNEPVALHFKNTKIFYESFLIKALEDKLYIRSVQSYNLAPHNGCRPKKLKRIKRRTKRMVLK